LSPVAAGSWPEDDTAAQTTRDELYEAVIERKLLGDRDEGLPIRRAMRKRPLRQKQAVSAGEGGEPLEGGGRRPGLEPLPVDHIRMEAAVHHGRRRVRPAGVAAGGPTRR